MTKFSFVKWFSLILFLLFPSMVFSLDTTKKERSPIVITSKMLIIDNKNLTAVFKNSVEAKTQDMILYADKMLIFFNKDMRNIKRIDACGNVRLFEDNRIITSEEATYDFKNERVIFTGRTRVIEGEKVVSGRDVIFYPSNERFFINNKNLIKK